MNNSAIAVLPFDTSYDWLFKNVSPAELSNDDLFRIEEILVKCINAYNKQQEQYFNEAIKTTAGLARNKEDFIIDLSRYLRQYVAVHNTQGEKQVWINGFCDAWGADWRKELILVTDGGNGYFQLKINLATGEHYDLMVNGNA